MGKKNFSKEKKSLLKTHKKFDGYPSDFNTQVAVPNQLVQFHSSATGNSLVTYAAIELLSIYFVKDEAKRKIFFQDFCRKLHENKFLSPDSVFEVLLPQKRKIFDLFADFVKQMVDGDLSSQSIVQNSRLFNKGILSPSFEKVVCFPNCYEQNFVEIEVIARGGFGVVCKARHKVDNIVYAVKKIPFKYTNDSDFKKVIREAQSFAQLKHLNIVRYNNAWIDNHIMNGIEGFSSSRSSELSDSEMSPPGSEELNIQDSRDIPSFSENVDKNDLTLLGRPCSNTINHFSDLDVPKDAKASSLVITDFNQNSFDVYENVACGESFVKETYKQFVTSYSSSSVTQISQNSDYSLSLHSENPTIQQSVALQSSFFDDDDDNELTGNSFSWPTRRRHSSGATCSSAHDQSEEAFSPEKTISNVSLVKTYSRCRSLDNPKSQAVVPFSQNASLDVCCLNLRATLYIQMELCDLNLRQWLDQRADANEGDPAHIKSISMTIFNQVLKGVEYIHSESIIHRDLKPNNIFLGKDNVVKIGDFGLATVCNQIEDAVEYSSSYCHSGVHGTPPYAAPEQKTTHEYDAKVDIYSLGIILVELLQPCRTLMEFFRTIEEILKGNFPEKYLNNWPEMVKLIRRMLSINPKERPSAKEILDDITPKIIEVNKDTFPKPSEELSENKMHSLLQELTKAKEEIVQLKAELRNKDCETIQLKTEIETWRTRDLEASNKINELLHQLIQAKLKNLIQD